MVNLLLTNSYLPLVEFKILKSDAKPFQGQSRLFKVVNLEHRKGAWYVNSQ